MNYLNKKHKPDSVLSKKRMKSHKYYISLFSCVYSEIDLNEEIF